MNKNKVPEFTASNFIEQLITNPDLRVIAIFDNRIKYYEVQENVFGLNPKKDSDAFVGYITDKTFSFLLYNNLVKNCFDYNSNFRQSLYKLNNQYDLTTKKDLLKKAKLFDETKTKDKVLMGLYNTYKATI